MRLQQGPNEGKERTGSAAVKLAKNGTKVVNTGGGSGRVQGGGRLTPGADRPKGRGGCVRVRQEQRLA